MMDFKLILLMSLLGMFINGASSIGGAGFGGGGAIVSKGGKVRII